MEAIVDLLNAVARAGRGLFDMALMAVGVAPTSIAVSDAVALPMGLPELAPQMNPVEVNPSTGYMFLFGPELADLGGYMLGEEERDPH